LNKKRFLKIVCISLFSLFFILFPLSLVAQAESVSGDINNNGVEDLKAFFKAESLSRVELDRNEDGQVDAWFIFVTGQRTWDTRADYDEDYDGRIDEIHFIKNDLPIRTLLDQDLNGFLDWETMYNEGIPMSQKKINPEIDPAQFNTQV